uniref:Uncharacterized protein n=1 Tax=Anas platyrhynchos TaxID=8839 RepID=A0A8B9TWA0_ANAPL
ECEMGPFPSRLWGFSLDASPRGTRSLPPGSFPRTPEPLAQGPISLPTLEKQYLHPRAL